MRAQILLMTGLLVLPAAPLAAQAFDHSAFDSVLARYVADGRVDYAALKANRGELDRYLESIGSVAPQEFQAWDETAQIAFLINAYNGYTLQLIIDHYPISGGGLIKRIFYPDNSIRQIGGAFDEIRHRVAGAELTLDDIEHGRLRSDYAEPRIHFALVCAAVSCPPLRREAYRGHRLDAQLDDQARRFLNDPRHNRYEPGRGRVYLSKIFEWFGQDFQDFAPDRGYRGDQTLRGVLAFTARYLPDRVAGFLRSGDYRVEFLDYDWTLNDQAIAAASR